MFIIHSVLIVSGEGKHRNILANAVSKYGLRSVCCETLTDANALLARQQFSSILWQEELPDGSFNALIRGRRGNVDKIPVIVVSHRDDWNSYLSAMTVGAFDYVSFPPNAGELERSLWLALSESQRFQKAFAKTAA